MSKPAPQQLTPTAYPSRIVVLEAGPSPAPLADALTRAGHQVTRVDGGDKLEAILKEASVALLVLDVRQASDAAKLLAACASALDSARGDARPVVVAVTSDGAPLASTSKGPALPVDLWSGPSAAAVARDLEAVLTARRLREALEEVQRLHDTVRFARSTAHDLAQPLTTILARTQLLMSRLPPEDAHYRPISIICQEAERMARIIEGFQSLKTMARQTASQGH